MQSPLNFVYGSSGIGSAFSSIRPFDIKHECRKGQPVMTTTNLFALRGTRSNQECCFFRSICQLCMSRQARQPPAATVIWISPSAARWSRFSAGRDTPASMRHPGKGLSCDQRECRRDEYLLWCKSNWPNRQPGKYGRILRAPGFLGCRASEGKKLHIHTQRSRITKPLPIGFAAKYIPLQGDSRCPM